MNRDDLLLVTAATLSIAILAVFPGRVIDPFLHLDSILHFAGGVAITLALAAYTDHADTSILGIVAVAAILFEPLEMLYFGGDLIPWMTGEDTILDITIAILASSLALIGLGRLR